MKTSILIEQGRTQLILDPESDHDKEVIKVLSKLPNALETEFYQARGGYTLQSESDKQLLIVFEAEKEQDIIKT